MYKLGALLLRDANVSLSEDEQSERLDQFVDDAYSVEYQLAQVSHRFIRIKGKADQCEHKNGFQVPSNIFNLNMGVFKLKYFPLN